MSDRPSEYWLAEQLADKLAGSYAWVPETRQGYAWRAGRWQLDRGMGWITDQATLWLQPSGMRADRRRIDSVLELLHRREQIMVEADRWDAQPGLLQTPAGVVDLTTGETRPARQSDYCLSCTAVAPGERRNGGEWWQHLLWMMRGDRESAFWLLSYLGYALTGCRREQSMLVLHGGGANGKSVLLDSLAAVLGDYASIAPNGLLTSRDGEVRPDAVAALQGARLVLADESEHGHRLNEGMIKSLTGSSSVSARQLHGKFYNYRPTGVYVIMTNHRPWVRGTDDGLWRRLQLVPCPAHCPPEEQDKELLPRLIDAHGPGILAQAIEAAVRYYREGLPPLPASICEATRDYRASSDALAAWMAEATIAETEARIGARALYQSYSRWCEGQGLRPESGPQFRDAMRDRGWVQRHTGQGMSWLGIRLRELEETDAEILA